MGDVFLKLLDMSIAASWLVLAVVLLRLMLKKAPRALTCALWALVGIRLVCPFSFESVLSLIPSPRAVDVTGASSVQPSVQPNMGTVNIAGVQTGNVTVTPVAPRDTVMSVLVAVWLVGVAAMLIYMLVSYLRIYIKVREAAHIEGNIWTCDRLGSPFILGVVCPRIYLPSSLRREDEQFVLAHERAHLRRLDHVWKPLGFVILTLHWFNPLMWVAYILLSRDIELACDEKVIKKLGSNIKKPYSEALINCSVPRKMISACPLAFGEVGVKRRIKTVLNYKRPAFWIVAVTVVALIVTAVCFLTDPPEPIEYDFSGELSERHEKFINKIISRENMTKYSSDYYRCEAHTVLGSARQGNELTVYAVILHTAYECVDGETRLVSSSYEPTVIKIKDFVASYRLLEYSVPENGTNNARDVRKMFPEQLRDKLDVSIYAEQFSADCLASARYHFDNNSYSGDNLNGTRWFEATLVAVNEDSLTVTPHSMTREATIAENITVNIANISAEDDMAILRIGNRLQITYSGEISTTEPYISDVVSINNLSAEKKTVYQVESGLLELKYIRLARYDLDGDGVMEELLMNKSETGFSIQLSRLEEVQPDIYEKAIWYYSTGVGFAYLTFETAEDGALIIKATPKYDPEQIKYFTLSLENGKLIVADDGVPLKSSRSVYIYETTYETAADGTVISKHISVAKKQ
ncbi:MAG: hypothetical protein IJY27_00580 [Clostridia bacterium]|nr:hypothetical protein [Clostridia bacterium]